MLDGEQAEAARAKLREPHLWTVMLLRDAERADAVEHYERKIAEHARPFNPLFAALVARLVARQIDASAEAAGAAKRANRLLGNLTEALAQIDPNAKGQE